MKPSIILTIDVEDWFQVENFKKYIEFSTWNSFESRVAKNTHIILDLLDKFSFKPKATFFILGWIARENPGLVKDIVKRGHEVASHGENHHLCTNLSGQDLLADLTVSKKRLEDITGQAVFGYRAPSFAVNDSILKVIRQAGFLYDSSFNSFSAHGRYGTIDLSTAEKMNGIYLVSPDFYELPVSNLVLAGKTIPFGGGGYFRLYPFPFFKWGVNFKIRRENLFIFYCHPWEFDPDQPKVEQASKGFKFRHYINLNKTEEKLKNLIQSFKNYNFTTCKDYILKQKPDSR